MEAGGGGLVRQVNPCHQTGPPSRHMRITSLEEICLLSQPTEELEIIDFSGSTPKDHASAEADSFWPLGQVHIFCDFWGLLW